MGIQNNLFIHINFYVVYLYFQRILWAHTLTHELGKIKSKQKQEFAG